MIFFWFFQLLGFNIEAIFLDCCITILFAIAISDILTGEIPPVCCIFLTVLGFFHTLIHFNHYTEYFLGAGSAGLIFYGIHQISKGRIIGGGDVKMIAAAGFLLGFPQIWLAVFIGFCIGLLYFLTGILHRKKRRVLFLGPFLSLGIFITIFLSLRFYVSTL